MSRRPVKRALVSVHDKRKLVPFARRLHDAGVELLSSGGTAATLAEAGLPVTAIEEETGAPEMLGGRVKTLHPRVHGAILADPNRHDHAAELEAHGIDPVELVVVDLYPFSATVASGAANREVIEHIDIGGVALIRAAAKNHDAVAIVTGPAQYDEMAHEVEAGGTTGELRRRLATEAFFVTAAYDAAIVAWFEAEAAVPERLVVPLRRASTLRYGENPHQHAGLYRREGARPWWGVARQLQGKEMSFNNYADADAAWRLVAELGAPAVVIVKHTNPCGVAVRDSLPAAFEDAWECDPLSAFGGVVAVNRQLDGATAAALASRFVEVVVAPSVDDGALDALAERRGLRVIEAPMPEGGSLELRHVDGGVLVQEPDVLPYSPLDSAPEGWSLRTEKPATAEELADLRLAWTVAAHTKSNAVVICSRGAAVGVGAGDQSRVGAALRAVTKAGDRARGAVAASDAFFPFRDGLDELAEAGVVAVVEPGGSKRDDEVIAAAGEHGIALYFTGRRHFRH